MWKKLVYKVLACIVIFMVVGCSNKEVSKEINVSKETESFLIKLTSAEIVENELNTDVGHVTLELGIEVKNVSKEDKGIGTGDFIIKTEDGEEYGYTGSENNFGAVIAAGDTLKGKGYYSIPKNAGNLVVVYRPNKSTEQVKWEIGTAEKEN